MGWVDTFRYLGVWINSKLTWTDHVSEARLKTTRLLNQGGICKNVASWPRLEHILHWFVPTLSHAHQSGLLTKRVPKSHWKRSSNVLLGGFVQNGTRLAIAGTKLTRNVSPI